MTDPTAPDQPVDPIEAEVEATNMDKTAYVKELAQAVQAELHPEAPNGDCSPYMEDAEKFAAMAIKGQAILERYHRDNQKLKELTRKNVQERHAREAKEQAEASKPAEVPAGPQTSPTTPAGASPGIVDPTLPLGGMSQGSMGAAAAIPAQTPNPQTVRGEPMPA